MSMTHMVRTCLITNPKSGTGGIDLAPILPVLAAHGWQVEVRQKLHGGHATELARAAVDEGFDVVVAGGGDGTVGEIVEGVLGSDVAVGVLPGGTANLWAHEIGVSMHLGEAALQLVGAQRRRVDVGHVTINGGRGQHFLLMAGLGVDAAVLERLSKSLKGRIGMLAYLPAIGRALPKATPFSVRLDLDGIARQSDAVQIVVGNTRRYASVTSLAPTALVDDGKLDVCVLTPGNPLSAAGQIATLVLRNRPSPFTAINDRVGHLTVHTTMPIPLQADGGRVKQKHIEAGPDGVIYDFTVHAQALTVLVPREYDGALFEGGARADSTLHPATAQTEQYGKSWYRVVSVGIDTLSVAQVSSGKVMTVKITPKTKTERRDGTEVSVHGFLALLSEGHPIQVKGETRTKRHTIVARRLRA